MHPAAEVAGKLFESIPASTRDRYSRALTMKHAGNSAPDGAACSSDQRSLAVKFKHEGPRERRALAMRSLKRGNIIGRADR